MLTCDYCRTALLDRQYGLLDAAEAAAVNAHVAACPACQAEQLRVERFGKLLTAAARTEFPDVRFVAPSNELFRREAQPSADGGGGRPPAAKRYGAWAVAAAILLAVGIPAGINIADASRQRSELAAATDRRDSFRHQQSDSTTRHVAELTGAQEGLQNARKAAVEAATTLTAKFAESQRELQQKQLNFTISGPATYQPGASADYVVQTRDPAGRPVPATVSYRVKDEAGKDVTEVTRVLSTGDSPVKLPPTVPLKPNTNLWLEVAAERADGTKAAIRERLSLAAPVYATHLATDKPMYQPGEVVRFRSLTLDRATLKPAQDTLNVAFAIKDALGAEKPVASGVTLLNLSDGKPVLGPDGKPVHGVAAGEWTIPADARGGEYTLVVKETSGRFPEERRKFLVNQYQAAKLNKVLEWSRKSFGPGAEVVANCKVTNATGPVANKPVRFQAVVDGKEIAGGSCGSTSADGSVAVRFTLPPQIDKGEGSLNVIFTDGGNRDSIVKPIPIALKKLAVEFYAEGGDLVPGTPNRVYFQARTTLGKPADLKGRIVDDKDRVVSTAETLTDDAEPGINQGMGRFEFTPENGRSYQLKIDEPVGTEGEYKLPDAKADGVALTVLGEVTGDPDPIRVRVASMKSERSLLIGAYARGRLLDHRRVTVEAGKSADVELKPEAGIGGVTRVTVFEELPGDAPSGWFTASRPAG
jgi:anti-sigma factor RsiW